VTATREGVRAALATIAATGCRPPWRGDDPDTDRAAVTRLWLDEATRRRLDDRALAAAAAAWASGPDTRWWPSPGDVLDRAPGPATATVEGCDRCTTAGQALVAVHRDGQVERWYAHCDCARGRHWAQRRAEPLERGGPLRPPGVTVAQLARAATRWPGVTAVYPYPTEAQRHPGCRVPPLSPSADARLRATLDAIREARGQPPRPASRWQGEDAGGPRW